jgi:hypothetical protein
MDLNEYDELLRRLTALVAKLDTTYDQLVEFNRQQGVINARLEQQTARLGILMERVRAIDARNQECHNGQETP